MLLMKKLAFILLLTATSFLWYCKKQAAVEEVVPQQGQGEYYPDGTAKFLKSLKVAEAEKITYDSLTKNFTVTMPTNFSADEITLALSFYSGISLLDSAGSAITATAIKFTYKGSDPLRFSLQETKGTKMLYTVYVNVPGQPNIELVNNEIPINAGPLDLPLRIISGLGTTPSTPGDSNPKVKLIDRKTNFTIEGTYYNKLIYAYIQDAGKLISSQNVALEINFAVGKKAVFENLKFKRGLPRASLSGNDNVLINKTDSILAYGGYYSRSEKYSVQFTNDFLSVPISLEMKFIDSLRISNAPKDIPDGSYLLTFFEGDKAIGKSSVYFSASKSHSIETIWKGMPELALSRNTEKLSFKKGDAFYAKPWPPKYVSSSGSNSSFTDSDLQILKLKNGTVTLELKPELAVVTWAVAGFKFAIGKYTIPENILSGSYEATLVFADKQESKPYWSKIEIR